jgi:ParB-like nuclease domain
VGRLRVSDGLEAGGRVLLAPFMEIRRDKICSQARPQWFARGSGRYWPLNRLVLSQSNVRRVKAGISIPELAEDIAQRTLLQSLSVRAVLDGDGKETGMFEVPAGGRRFRALELLVTSKRMAKDQPVPCVVREGGNAVEDSVPATNRLAKIVENDFAREREDALSKTQRAAFHFALNVSSSLRFPLG